MPYKDPERARAYQKNYRAKNPQKVRRAIRDWEARHPEYKIAHYIGQADNRKAWRDKQPADYDNVRHRKAHRRDREMRLGRTRPDVCDACGGADGPICYDHCHTRGHPRGWLCNGCNIALGMVKDDPARLLKLVAYLKRTMVSPSPQLSLPGV
jgi:hypothetical protein